MTSDLIPAIVPLAKLGRRPVLERKQTRKAPIELRFLHWLPVEDYFQTPHGLVIPADLIAA